MKFTLTIETVIEIEQAGAKGQWRIGDALAKDLVGTAAVPDRKLYSECANLLEAKGYDKYDAAYLARLHRTAKAFPRSERDERYSWDAHNEAGTPANLKKAATALRKLGKTITIYNVRDIIGHWRSKATDERQTTKAAAQDEEAKAKDAKKKATEDRLAAKTEPERDAAEQRRQAAIQRIEKARKEIKASTGAPPFNTDLKVDPTDATALQHYSVYMVTVVHTTRMKKLAQKIQKDLADIVSVLSAGEKQAIADDCDSILTLVQDIQSMVAQSKRAKLTVVN